MSKPILVITHERAGTHLTINLINYQNRGEFTTIGYLPKVKNKIFTKQEYINTTYKHIYVFAYVSDLVCKSHHQVQFMEDYLDFVFDRYYVIYVERDVKDVLISYYRFLFGEEQKNIPLFEDWIFMKPSEVGEKHLLSSNKHLNGPDPHIYIEPENYVQRWKWHKEGWLKHKEHLLHITYEDLLEKFDNTKQRIENHIKRKIGDVIPDLHDKQFPNFKPNKGIVGDHKEVMDEKLIKKISEYL